MIGTKRLHCAAIRRVAAFLLFVIANSGAFGSSRYFPTGALGGDAEFIERWYSGQLTALKEQPLCCGSKESHRTVRFT
jgi:hypothetical protein